MEQMARAYEARRNRRPCTNCQTWDNMNNMTYLYAEEVDGETDWLGSFDNKRPVYFCTKATPPCFVKCSNCDPGWAFFCSRKDFEKQQSMCRQCLHEKKEDDDYREHIRREEEENERLQYVQEHQAEWKEQEAGYMPVSEDENDNDGD